MSFPQVLTRLKEASNGQRGRRDQVLISVNDLQALLLDWERLDTHVRTTEIETRQLKADLAGARNCVAATMAIENDLRAENTRLQSVIDEASAQEAVLWVGKTDYGTLDLYRDLSPVDNEREWQPLYARPIPAQQSPAVAVPESPSELLAAYNHLLSNRITGRESFEIILSFYWFMENFKSKNGRNPSVVEWYEAEGRALLDKLNKAK